MINRRIFKLVMPCLFTSVALCQDRTVAAYDAAPWIDQAISDAVKEGLIPGAVLVVGHNGQVIYRKAYGYRALIPEKEPMTADTIFDAASLTKVVATTPSIMKLFEEGRIRLDDPVTKYLPEFEDGHSSITIRNLMTHFSGLRPDLDLKPRWSGYETGVNRALREMPVTPPGTHFTYSDINFILLGEIVHRVSGQMLNVYAREEIYKPLGMDESQFLPPASLRARIAPTEIAEDTGRPLRGVVDDPTARYMGGVAGDAGLFTTADDLAKYCQMWLNKGSLTDAGAGTTIQIFNPLTIRKFTEPGGPPDQPILRALGWDVDSPYSSNRGELYPLGSFGHTGYTGTSIWIDPTTNSYVVLLTNVVHPHAGKSLSSLRSRIATLVAGSFGVDTPGVSLTSYNETMAMAGVHRAVARNAETLTGLDVLEREGFAPLRGKRIGLITNQTGLDREGKRNVDLMLTAGIKVTTLYSPEHGIAGTADANVSNSRDAATGLPIVSLFQPNQRRLTPDKMKDVDALVYDIQDVGARFYTYSCTLLYAVEGAAKAHKPFFVLDRPNPITGTHVEGPMLDSNLFSFTGCYSLPVRHGMTFGELATMANAEQHWGAELHVVKMTNWQRGDWFDSSGLVWVNPSPNMRSLDEALLYPGIAMLEAATNYSVGRGTDTPFEQIGADWMDGRAFAKELNSRFIPGVRVYPTRFEPVSSHFAGKQVEGIRFVVTDRQSFDSVRLGLEVATALQKLYPGKISFDACKWLIGSQAVIERIKAGNNAQQVDADIAKELPEFLERRKRFLLY
ncbi:MAG: exo-beta-N-acetylmuramidase NamZ domain-containing protein [Bryobacteraceae bacterium]